MVHEPAGAAAGGVKGGRALRGGPARGLRPPARRAAPPAPPRPDSVRQTTRPKDCSSRRTTRAGGRLAGGRRTTWAGRTTRPGREKPGAAGADGRAPSRRSEPAGYEIGPGRRLYQKSMRHRFKLVGFQCQVQRRRFRAAAAR